MCAVFNCFFTVYEETMTFEMIEDNEPSNYEPLSALKSPLNLPNLPDEVCEKVFTIYFSFLACNMSQNSWLNRFKRLSEREIPLIRIIHVAVDTSSDRHRTRSVERAV